MKQSVIILFAIGLIGLSDCARRFPSNFKFGTATASYQIEGAWDKNGKGENIWDRLTHTTNLVVDGSTGDVACDSYHNYKRDVEMLVELGVDFYRFSLSWTRLLPNGRTNMINQDGIDYYNNLINELLANGIEPAVTLYHWDLPQPLQEIGGWTNPLMADYFTEYAGFAFEAFGDRVKMWLTLNEPSVCCLQGYGGDSMAPAINYNGIGEYLCAHTMIRAHGKAYRLYESSFKPSQQGRVSLTTTSGWVEPTNETSAQVVDDALSYQVGWFSNPIFSLEGDYPKILKEKVYNKSISQGFPNSRLPEFTQEEINYIRGSYDFYGLNHYTSSMIKERTDEVLGPVPSYEDDSDYYGFKDPSWPGSASSWLKVVPWGLTKLLGWIRTTYRNPELIIFENGFSDLGGLQDVDRVNYYHLYLNALLDAIDEGSFVSGYTAWSLMDNFEWLRGYTERFGLYEVDFDDDNRTRTPKMSALYYKEIVQNRTIDEVLTEDLLDRINYVRNNLKN